MYSATSLNGDTIALAEDVMGYAWNCTEPKEAHALVNHYMGGLFAGAGSSLRRLDKAGEVERVLIEERIGKARAEVIGHLSVIAQRMYLRDHRDIAMKIQEVVAELIHPDSINVDTLERIHDVWKSVNEEMLALL